MMSLSSNIGANTSELPVIAEHKTRVSLWKTHVKFQFSIPLLHCSRSSLPLPRLLRKVIFRVYLVFLSIKVIYIGKTFVLPRIFKI